MSETEILKAKLQAKISSLNNRLNTINGEIVQLDKQIADKKAEFLRTQGAITGMQMTLNEIIADEKKAKDDKSEKEDVQGESEDEG